MVADDRALLADEPGLLAACLALGAREIGPLSDAERELLGDLPPRGRQAAARLRSRIEAGADPLGDAFARLRAARARRARGATYSPATLVDLMLELGWSARRSDNPARVVDPGAGSARFLLAAGRRFPDAALVGVELDPVAALMARANLAAAGFADRAVIICTDYRHLELDAVAGPTLFCGNPPYVRHHGLDRADKAWLKRAAAARGLDASGLAGLHVHFFVATLAHARAGDRGCLVTAAEWLDVNYGSIARELFAGPLGLERLDLLDPRATTFDDAQTTSVIATFEVGGAAANVGVRALERASALGSPGAARPVPRARLAAETRWSGLFRARRTRPRGWVELGELCRVHRGQVTGANRIWIATDDTPALPGRFLLPAITRARELFDAGAVLVASAHLRRAIALPAALDDLSRAEGELVERFLRWARKRGGHRSYIARHRSPWWQVRFREPAPILATYMARRPPAFVRNLADARHINIAHGIYPREPLAAAALDALAAHLTTTAELADGRVYAGGLTKFEPKEMERLLVPPAVLSSPSSC